MSVIYFTLFLLHCVHHVAELETNAPPLRQTTTVLHKLID